MAFCSTCGNQIPAGAAVCPVCGPGAAQPVGQPMVGAVQPASGGLTDNMAGALAYVTIIPAIVFLVLEPYNRSRFIRFHSFQCIFFHVAWTVLWIGLAIFGHIPVLGWATLLLWPLVGLAGLIIWILLVVKAYGGQMFKLPVIGDIAEKQANTV